MDLEVASLAEAWIEMPVPWSWHSYTDVASLAEAWIEILMLQSEMYRLELLPLRKRGLK